MGNKHVFIFTVLLLWKVCKVHGQGARVEYVNQPYCGSPVVTTVQTPPQVVVPGLYKPCDSYIQETAPIVPSFNGYSGINGFNNPISGYDPNPGFFPGFPGPMPPIIVDDDDDDNWHHLLYFLIFAMRNRRCGGGYGGCGGYNGNGGCGGGCNGGYGGGCNGGCGGGCNGGCSGGCNGGCGGGCNGGCGGGCNSGYGSYSGGCGGNCGGGCSGGYNDGFGGCNNNCGCSYLPYPFPIPFNGAFPCGCGYQNCGYQNCGNNDNSCSCVDDCCCQTTAGNEINLIIRTEPNCNC